MATDTKTSALTTILGADTATGDKAIWLDISDTTQGPTGTLKTIIRSELVAAIKVEDDRIGAFSAADETKLDGIETGATTDQTDAEIKTAYENNADTNAFTDAEQTKLSGIETGATADQTAGEIEAIVFHDNLQGVAANEHIDWTAATDAFSTTIADTDNVVGITVTQNDTTNNPNSMNIVNAGSGNGLFLNQDGNGSAINIDSEATTAGVINITTPATTTGFVIDITNVNSLTTGGMLNAISRSADSSVRNLIFLHNDDPSATGATCLNIRQDAAQRALLVDQNADNIAIQINSEATTANVIQILGAKTTSGIIVDINNVDDLITGNIARFRSNSSNTGVRNLVEIINDHVDAVNVNALFIKNDGAGDADAGVLIKFNNAPAANTTGAVTSFTVGQTIQGHIKVDINGTTRFIPFFDAPTS